MYPCECRSKCPRQILNRANLLSGICAVVLLYPGGVGVGDLRTDARMHEMIIQALKRNESDEDMDVPQQHGAWAKKRRCSMTEVQTE